LPSVPTRHGRACTPEQVTCGVPGLLGHAGVPKTSQTTRLKTAGKSDPASVGFRCSKISALLNTLCYVQAVAARHKWEVVGVFEDAGISGAKGREGRPGLDAMMKVVARREVDMVAAWSVDRLGRSLIDLLGFLGELHSKGVDLFLHQQGLDTSTPSGRAMFQMMGVFAEFERAMIRERVLAGIARARDQGTQLGRRRLEETDAKKVAAIRSARKKGVGVRRIARDLGVGVGTVLRLTAEA
jgi:DNA invertase Pin-like site-specific DNA recombinase